MATAERRFDVLRAIVSDYVATREPVGSNALAKRHDLGVSPATIRNDMAALEQAGLIYQPHTSVVVFQRLQDIAYSLIHSRRLSRCQVQKSVLLNRFLPEQWMLRM